MDEVVTDEDVKQIMAINVQWLLEARGWNAARLAKETGESEMNISRVLRAANCCKTSMAARIADALDTTVDWLITKHPEKISYEALLTA